RWTSATDVAIASPVAGRTYRELEELVGLFVNTLVLRADLARNPAFDELVGQVRDEVAAAMAHQDVPFEMLVEDFEGARTLGHAPITPVVFAFQNIPTSHLVLADLGISTFEFERTTARFDLCLFVTEQGERLGVSIEYRRDLFDAATAR